MATNTWSVSTLSEARGDIATVVVNNKLYFAGGSGGYSVSPVIDIYDGATGTWSVSNLASPVAGPGVIRMMAKYTLREDMIFI